MKKGSYWLLLVGSLLFTQACNENKRNSGDSVENAHDANDLKEQAGTGQEDDSNDFVVKAAAGGLLEVELGRLVQEKAQSAEVKAFGKMMMDDHSKANEELKALAARKNITLPGSLGEDEQKHVSELRELSGAEFDKKYVDMMVEDHKKDIDLFEEAAEDEKDADLKAFAAQQLPTLRQHLDRIKALDKD